ncbi:MAG: YihY/virulence factor BrkB family protein [Bacteroidota bacterium]
MLKQFLLRLTFVKLVISLSKKLIIPGFDGLPLYEVAHFFFTGLFRGAITTRASAISFNFFLAIFPAIIFAFTLIPYIPIDHFQDVLMDLLKNVLPSKTYEASISTLDDIINQPRGGLLSIGFILALYFATNGINALIMAFNNTYHAIESRTGFMQRLISIALVIILTILIFTAITLLIGTNITLDYLAGHGLLNDWISLALISLSRWIILIALCFFGISFVYYLAPAKKLRYRFVSAGSSLATILSIIASIGFNFYANNFAKYNVLYGSIGTLILIMMWIYFNAIILLIGFELNASIFAAKNKKQR